MAAIIFGAMEGGGFAGERAGLQAQKQLGEEKLLEKKQLGDEKLLKQRLDAERDMHVMLEGLRQTHSEKMARLPYEEATKAGVEAEKASSAPAYDAATDTARPQSPAEKAESKSKAYMRSGHLTPAHQVEESERQRQRDIQHGELTREQIASQKEIAAGQVGIQREIANLHAVVQREIHGPTAALATEQLKAYKNLSALRDSYADAVRSGDKEAMKTLPKRIEALGYTGDKTDTTNLISIAGAATKMATAIDTPDNEKVFYRDVARLSLSAAMGQKDVEQKGRTGWESTTGDVFVDGQKIGTAKTEAEARKVAAARRAAPATSPIPQPPAGVVNGQVTAPSVVVPARGIVKENINPADAVAENFAGSSRTLQNWKRL